MVIELPCTDCGTLTPFEVRGWEGSAQVPWLCAPCLVARVAQVLAARPHTLIRPGRGRQKEG